MHISTVFPLLMSEETPFICWYCNFQVSVELTEWMGLKSSFHIVQEMSLCIFVTLFCGCLF